MKYSTFLLPLYASSAVAASVWSDNSQKHLSSDSDSEDHPVPGENPLEFCEDPSDNILQIETVNLLPNPPEAGKTLSIQANGTLSQQVDEGAYVLIEVKYGLIKILTLREDLCDQMKNIDKECPVEKGDTTLSKDVDLPNRIPPGTYSVKADVFDKDDEKITCLQATIRFG